MVLGTRQLAYRIGPIAARQIQIENRPVEVDEALALNLVDAVADTEGWDALSRNFAAN